MGAFLGLENEQDGISTQPTSGDNSTGAIEKEVGFSSDEHLFDSEKSGNQELGENPQDPRNWTKWKKNSFLLIISAAAFLADFGSSTGSITLLPQSMEWHLPLTTINHALVGSQFMIGAGGLVVVTLSAYFGRLPVLFYFLSLSVATAVWCAAATTFDSFMTARILNGFFSSVAQGGGLMWISDLFITIEQPRKINFWSSFIIIAPFTGPLVSAFIVNRTTWPWVFWLLTMLSAVCWILVVLFVDETFFIRAAPPRTNLYSRSSRLLRLLGVEQYKQNLIGNSFKQALMRPAVAITKLPILLSSVYYMLTCAWVIGLNAAIGVFTKEVYGFHYQQIGTDPICPVTLKVYYQCADRASGFFNFAPIVGVLLGALISYALQAAVQRSKRHFGHIETEARLLPIWFATLLMVVGIVMVGVCLQRRYPVIVLAVVWALYISGIMIVTTSVNAYCLESYPEASGEVAAWINEGRILGGFVVNYFELKWIKKMGAVTALGIQAAIVVAAFGIIVVLQIYGPRLRKWQGPMNFTTN